MFKCKLNVYRKLGIDHTHMLLGKLSYEVKLKKMSVRNVVVLSHYVLAQRCSARSLFTRSFSYSPLTDAMLEIGRYEHGS